MTRDPPAFRQVAVLPADDIDVNDQSLAWAGDPDASGDVYPDVAAKDDFAAALDALADRGVRLLRRVPMPGTVVNIESIAIGSSGVYVLDAKRYQGRPHLRLGGGLLRRRGESLLVGRRDCTELVTLLRRQVGVVSKLLAGNERMAAVPVRGLLVFLDGDWPVLGGAELLDGVEILWPELAIAEIGQLGLLGRPGIDAIHDYLADCLPT